MTMKNVTAVTVHFHNAWRGGGGDVLLGERDYYLNKGKMGGKDTKEMVGYR